MKVIQLFNFIKSHGNVHFKWMNFIIFKLYSNKTILKKLGMEPVRCERRLKCGLLSKTFTFPSTFSCSNLLPFWAQLLLENFVSALSLHPHRIFNPQPTAIWLQPTLFHWNCSCQLCCDLLFVISSGCISTFIFILTFWTCKSFLLLHPLSFP